MKLFGQIVLWVLSAVLLIFLLVCNSILAKLFIALAIVCMIPVSPLRTLIKGKGSNILPVILAVFFLVVAVVIDSSTGSREPEAVVSADSAIEEAVSPEPEKSEPVQEAAPSPAPSSEPTPAPTPEDTATMGEKNALKSAASYLDFTAFSYTGLIEQLEYEGYTTEEATYAADNCGADWNEQAVLSAKSYLDFTAFSYAGMIDQLEYDGFTPEEATYGADNCGADWFEQAVKSAQSYLDFTSFSRDGLIDQLIYDGFTADQAEHAAAQAGY